MRTSYGVKRQKYYKLVLPTWCTDETVIILKDVLFRQVRPLPVNARLRESKLVEQLLESKRNTVLSHLLIYLEIEKKDTLIKNFLFTNLAHSVHSS